MITLDLDLLKTGLIGFWAVWLTVVWLSNTCEGLKALGLLPERWRWVSGNYREITDQVPLPPWATGLLFAGVVAWQTIGVVLFWNALYRYGVNGSGDLAAVYIAFAVTLGLWAGFMVADEVFFIYDQQTTHMLLFIAQLASLMAIVLLPG
ncbi:MAG: hypothetical protein PVF47_02225 [Anaerolineae bacterium]|jgi:hypothetical protein